MKKFIHISTDEVYGDVPVGAADLSETSILASTNTYLASKAAAEMMVSAYRSSFKLPLITVRANNVYGPHQFPESGQPQEPRVDVRSRLIQKSFRNSSCCYNENRSSCFTVMGHLHHDIFTPETL